MRHALASVYTILNSDIQGRSRKDTLHHARHALHCQEEILDLSSREVIKARHDPSGRNQHMAREEWFEVHYGKRQTRQVEDLRTRL
jgi:hypothetical protein